MILSERHIIKQSHKGYKDLEHMCFLSKNLYNKSLYMVRQHFFDTGKYMSYYELQKVMQDNRDVDYYALPTKVSQQILRLIDKNFKSFFSLLKLKKNKKYDRKISIPKYLDKQGKNVLIFTIQSISKTFLKKGYIKLSGCDLKVKTHIKDVKMVRVVPKGNHIVVEVIYEKEDKALREHSTRICSIDIGLNNLATVGSNVMKPFILNGRPLKSINQYYNKKYSKLKSKLILKNGKYTSKQIESLTLKRNNKIQDYLHKASSLIVKHLVSNDIDTLIIGHNKEWKSAINMGRNNNQKFVSIPHSKFIHMLEYKCKLEGILTITTEESYTSKCSFLDQEEIKKQINYKGVRTKRGLFKTSDGRLINADLNGALNILKKVVGNFDYDPIEVCSTPLVLTIKL